MSPGWGAILGGHRPSVRGIRLFTGLIAAAYVISHLVNHSLGILSIEAMDAYRRVNGAIWQSPPGTVLLYGSLLCHLCLGLQALYRRSHLRLKPWEWAQLVLGLAVPFLLIEHIIGARIAPWLIGFDATYGYVLSFIWLDQRQAILQSLLIVIVWAHFAIGLHFWLRLKPWHARLAPILHVMGVLVPLLALIGFSRAGMTVESLATDPAWLNAVRKDLYQAPPELISGLVRALPATLWGFAGLLGLVLVGRQIRRLFRNRRGTIRVDYPGGESVEAPVGATILEASRLGGLPHASVCGGRGRCTTCRVQVVAGLSDLEPPSELEARALTRINAEPEVRLACQTCPRRNTGVLPLLPPTATARDGRRPGGLQGKELSVAILFVDLRGSTRLGEARLPYDVVFILNQFFAEMADALKETNGHYAQFNGDGLMALYGLDGEFAAGCRDAIAGGLEMQRRMGRLNRAFEAELGRPLQIGVGIHGGDAIVGSMGPPTSPNMSAIGDNVNLAARLEGLTKDYGCDLVVSTETARQAGLDLSAYPRHDAEVRGRDETIEIFALPATLELPDDT